MIGYKLLLAEMVGMAANVIDTYFMKNRSKDECAISDLNILIYNNVTKENEKLVEIIRKNRKTYFKTEKNSIIPESEVSSGTLVDLANKMLSK